MRQLTLEVFKDEEDGSLDSIRNKRKIGEVKDTSKTTTIRDYKSSFRRTQKPRKEELERLYIEKKLSTYKIAELYNVSYGTALKWLRQYNIPRRKPFEYEKLKYKWKPFHCSELAYVIGVILGDGHLGGDDPTKKNILHLIRLTCRDKEFAEAFKDTLEKLGFQGWTYFKKERWRISLKCKVLWQFLKQFKEDVNKVLDWIESEEEKRSFIRGIYDSEGSLNKKRYQISINNTNKRLLEIVQIFLEELGIKSKLSLHHRAGHVRYSKRYKRFITNRKDLWLIQIYKQVNVRRFLELIGSSIPRKRDCKKR